MNDNNKNIIKSLSVGESREKLGKFFACIIFVLFVSFVGFYTFDLYMGNKSLSFLKINIDAELGFVVNGNNNVVYYLPLNDRAMKIYNSSMFKGLNRDEAVEVAIEVAKENNYLLSDERKAELTVISNNASVIRMHIDKIKSIINKKDNRIITEVVDATESEITNFGKINLENINDVSSIYSVNDETGFKKCDYTKVKYESLSGLDKFISGINTSKKMYPNGTKNVVLISYTDMLDGYLAIPFANSLNAPILMVKYDGVTNEVLGEIERLKASNIYVIGGYDIISNKVDTVIKTKFNIDVKRIGGNNRYINGIEIAKEMDNFSSVVIVPNTSDGVDAVALASISAKMKMPIFYSDIRVVNRDIKEYIKSNKNVNNIYLVGDSFNKSFINEINTLGRHVEVINGKDRYDSNVTAITKFNNEFKNIVLVDNNVDAISASLLAAKSGNVLFYTKNVIDDGHLSLLNGNNIENIYYYDNYQGFKELLFSVKKRNISSCEDSTLNLLLGTKKAVFYVPHQDDETLYYGQTITAAVDVLGKENVYVVLLTDGNSSNAKNKEFIKNGLNNYNSVNEKKLSFSGARDNEYRRALIEMGVENIHVIETFGNNRFNEGAFIKGTKFYNGNLIALKNLIVSYSSKFDDVTHFAFTNLDDNDDHEALGTVLTSLYYDKNVSGFENVYLIVKSTEMVGHNRHVIPDNTAKKYIREDNILDKYSVVLNYSEGFERIRKAFTKFGYYENSECVSDGDLLGIGCISDKALFERINARLDKNAELPLDTVIHIPFKK